MDFLTRSLLGILIPVIVAITVFTGSYSLITLFLSIIWWQIIAFGLLLEMIGGSWLLKTGFRKSYILFGAFLGLLVGGSVSFFEYLDIMDDYFSYLLMGVGFLLGGLVAWLISVIDYWLSKRSRSY
jgi:hypothetical protein